MVKAALTTVGDAFFDIQVLWLFSNKRYERTLVARRGSTAEAGPVPAPAFVLKTTTNDSGFNDSE